MGGIVLHCEYSRHATKTSLTIPLMRRNATAVGFGARLPRHHKEELDAIFPFGGKTWATERGLEIFIELCEQSPELQSYVHDQVLQMRVDGPPTNLREFVAVVKRDLYNRFNRMFPEKGASTWFLRKFVPALNNRMAVYERFEPEIRGAVLEVLEADRQ